MSSFTREDLKNWFRDTHPSAQQPTQDSSEDGLLTESYGDMNDPYNPDANPAAVMGRSRANALSTEEIMKLSNAGFNVAGIDRQNLTADMREVLGLSGSGPANASAISTDTLRDKLEDLLAEEFANSMADGLGLKDIAAAVESALDMAHLSVNGREMDHRVEITPTPVRQRR
jgi:hypothetical protein